MEVENPINIDIFHLSLARDVLDVWPESEHLQELINTVEAEIKNNSDKAIDAAKCLVESVCKTILTERGVEFDAESKVQGLLKMTLKTFGIEKSSGDHSIRDIATGFETAINGIAHIRNNYGPLSHGRDAYHQKVRDTIRYSIVRSVEMMAVQLIELHISREPSWKYTRKPFDNYNPINLLVDDLTEIVTDTEDASCVVNGIPFRPSQILYDLDRDSYVEMLLQIDSATCISDEMLSLLADKYPGCMKSNILSIKFVHLSNGVHLCKLYSLPNGPVEMDIEGTDFIGGPYDGLLFSPDFTAQQNADKFINDFDTYSIINCFDFFTDEACQIIASEHEKGVKE